MKLNQNLSKLGLMGHSLVEEAVNFTKPFEGFSAAPYWDYKQWTWGHGTYAGSRTQAVKPSGTITHAKAHNELADYIEDGLLSITNAITKPITKNQLIALSSFNVNLGFGNTKNLIRRINEGLPAAEVAAAFRLYNKAGGKVLPALVTRRDAEAKKFLS